GGAGGGGAVVRVAPPGSTSVDRRPTTILITGFVEEEAETLLEHFKQFGEVTKHQLDKTEPSLQISFSTRPVAEKALARGKQFNKKLLSIVWQQTAAIAPTTPTGGGVALGANAVAAATPAETGKAGDNPLVHSSSGGGDDDDGLASTKLLDIDESSTDRMVLIGGGGGGGGSGVGGADINSSSLETLTETDELIDMPHMVEEEEDDDDMEGERSWRR
uniref:RRM domain-containing protein n=1 Tax=Anopheles maculatus TaxID=74869 RepID=A0A182T3A2_9DIPT